MILCLCHGHHLHDTLSLSWSSIRSCLPHDLILEKLKFYGMDEKSLSLFNSYLTMHFQRVKLEGTFSTWSEVIRGVPQGSILGPLLFNIFMNDLVYAIKESKLTNYADDAKLHYSHKDPDIVETEINKDLDRANTWFVNNGMKVNPTKHQAMILGNCKSKIQITLDGTGVPVTNHMVLLGMTIDNKLKFDMHVAGVCRKVGRQINVLNRLKNILPLKTKEALYHSFVLPYFNYCSQVWHHCGTRNARKLEKANERALRYVYKDKHKSYNELLEIAGQVTLKNRRIQDILITVNNCLMNRAPESIKKLISLRKSKYDLRGDNVLSIPKVNTTKKGLKSWRYFAPRQWNNLDNSIRSQAGTTDFVRTIRNETFEHSI